MSENAEWGEAGRERLYWIVSLLLVVSGPILAVASFHSFARLSLEGYFSPLVLIYFIGLLIGSIVLPILIELAFTRGKNVWIKFPEVTAEQRIAGDYNRWVEEHGARLREAGFAIIPAGQPSQWRIEKPKRGNVHSFGDHAFSGIVTITDTGFGPTASLSLRFEDIIVIETGEIGRMRGLAARLLGAPAVPDEPTVPFTVLTAVVMGVIAHTCTYLSVLADPGFHLPIFEAAFFAVGEAVWMTVVVLVKRKELIGLRIAVAMIFAGGAPFIALALGKLM